MPTNNFQFSFTTDDYDIFSQYGPGTSTRPGTEVIDETNHIYDPNTLFPPSTLEPPPLPDDVSMMDKDENINGPINDFWSDYPIAIDVSGYLLYHGENTGINVRGPIGSPNYIHFDELTTEQKAELKGIDGIDGRNGVDGERGQNGNDGLSAYEEWVLNGHPEGTLNDFYTYIASFVGYFIHEGTGQDSLLFNDNNQPYHNTASGDRSIAAGSYTTASGDNSFSNGDHTIAGYNNQFVIGQYNNNQSTNLFEIGNGTSNTASNAFTVASDGTITAGHDVIDGYGNILSHKVNQIPGKQLSTNDYTTEDATKLRNLTIDSALSQQSINPVQNKVVTEALNNIATSSENKIGVELVDITQNQNYPLISVRETSQSSGNTYLNKINNLPKLLYNANKHNFNINIGTNSNISSSENIFMCGYGLSATNNNQWIFGKFNNSDTTSQNFIFQIGNGTDTSHRSNLMSVTREGDIVALHDVVVGNHQLTQKQNALSFDALPTENSDSVITSGDLYNLGYNPSKQQFYPTDLTTALSYITDLQNRVHVLEAIISEGSSALQHEIKDDSTHVTYSYGIDNGVFYIKQKDIETEGE